jgi:ADP-heptose:LPS heptosyltransferase
MAALLARCRLAVGVDTGLLHIAAAVGTRYVGLFGPTNPHVTGPYDRSLGTALVAPFPKSDTCAGCWRQFKYIDDHCRTIPGGSCTGALQVEVVIDACRADLLRNR